MRFISLATLASGVSASVTTGSSAATTAAATTAATTAASSAATTAAATTAAATTSDEVDQTLEMVIACAAECPALSKHMTRFSAVSPVSESYTEDVMNLYENDERRCLFHPICLDCQEGSDCPMATCFAEIEVCKPLVGVFALLTANCACAAGVDFGSKPGQILGDEFNLISQFMTCPEEVKALPAQDTCYGPGEAGSSDAYTMSATAAALVALVHLL